jgi:hypothetical protein
VEKLEGAIVGADYKKSAIGKEECDRRLIKLETAIVYKKEMRSQHDPTSGRFEERIMIRKSR